jgi:hypothetical protein
MASAAPRFVQRMCISARTVMSFRDALARADVRSRSAGEAEGTMVKQLCIGLAAVAYLTIAIADAADLSMTPIYQTRPSAAAPTGSVKDQSRPADALDRERFKLSPSAGAVTSAGAPLSGHVFWTGVYDRF